MKVKGFVLSFFLVFFGAFLVGAFNNFLKFLGLVLVGLSVYFFDKELVE